MVQSWEIMSTDKQNNFGSYRQKRYFNRNCVMQSAGLRNVYFHLVEVRMKWREDD